MTNAPAPSRDAATSPALMTGGTFHPADGHRPPRLVLTPQWPVRFLDGLHTTAKWGWGATHPSGGWPEEVRQRVMPMNDRASVRTVFTPTEIADFDWCDHLHFYRHRQGITRTTINTRAPGEPLDTAQRGSALHYFIAHRRPEVADAEMLRRAVLEQDPRADVAAEVCRLLPAAERHVASALEARVQGSAEHQREVPFYLALDTLCDVHLEGRVDLMFREADAWTVVDYKSSALDMTDDVSTERALRHAARRHEAQVALYCLVLDAVVTRVGERVDAAMLAFPESGATIEYRVTGAWLEGWQRRLLQHVQRMRGAQYQVEPTWDAERCGSCPMLRLCQPAGMP